jgi:probable rRNA maturation factor
MTISFETLVTIDESLKQILEDTIKKSAEILLYDIDLIIGITICDDEFIKNLNIKFRHKDSATDVLSFPMLDSKTPGEVIISDMDYDPETHEVILGDIVISFERAKAQAEEYNHSIVREMCYLAVHSMLHLVGYDHMNDDKNIMRQKEEEILNKLCITR